MQIREVMTPKPDIVGPDVPIDVTARQMKDRNIWLDRTENRITGGSSERPHGFHIRNNPLCVGRKRFFLRTAVRGASPADLVDRGATGRHPEDRTYVAYPGKCNDSETS